MPQFSQRPRGLLEPYAGMTGTYGSEGGPPFAQSSGELKGLRDEPGVVMVYG